MTSLHATASRASVSDACDVCVIGAGPSGSLVARQLSRSGLRVVLVQHKVRFPAAARSRVDTLPPEANDLFLRAGLAEEFSSCHPVECPGIVSRWDSNQPVELEFLFNSSGPAWHVHRSRFDRWMQKQALQSGATLIAGSFRHAHSDSSSGWLVEVQRERGLCVQKCDFLVDATGRRAVVGRNLKSRWQFETRQVAATTWLPAIESMDDQRLQIARTPRGWCSLVPPVDNQPAQFSFFAAPEFFRDSQWPDTVISELEHFAANAQLSELTAFTTMDGLSVSGVRPLQWHMTPASMAILCPGSGSRWMAVGDALFSLDPLSGQGLYWALETALSAARIISESGDLTADSVQYYENAVQQFRLLKNAQTRLTTQAVIGR